VEDGKFGIAEGELSFPSFEEEARATEHQRPHNLLAKLY